MTIRLLFTLNARVVGLMALGLGAMVVVVGFGHGSFTACLTQRALDGATGAAKEQARRNEFLCKYFPFI